MKSKTCTKCQRELNLDNYCKKSSTKDGLSIWCRECKAEANRSWRYKNIDKLKPRERENFRKVKHIEAKKRKNLRANKRHTGNLNTVDIPDNEVLNERFTYTNGCLYMKKSVGSRSKGSKVGTVSRGYSLVQIEGTLYKLHRVIYKMHHGTCPQYIDHIDGNPLNNKIENLRASDKYKNQWNTRPRAGSSKYKGVSLIKKSGKWAAKITYMLKEYRLGTFDREIEAAKAYNNKAIELYGEHAKINQLETV